MSKPLKYRKKPVVIEAMRFAGTNAETHAVYQWVEKNTLGTFDLVEITDEEKPFPTSGVSIDPSDGRMVIATLEGLHWVNVGDYVIRGVAGEFYPCRSDIFNMTCEIVEDQ